MHVPSGLFAQGHYARAEHLSGTDSTFWMVQAGITKNWWGPGNTSFYGEVGRADDFIKSGPAGTATLIGAQPGVFIGLPAASSEVSFWGLGVVQQIDAAAMELFLGWRRFDSEVVGAPAGANGTSDLDLVSGGARIRF
jgi:hypothetical protein